MKKFLISIGIVGLVTLVAGVWTGVSAKVLGQGDRNCTSTAVVKCGAFNQNELNSRMTASSRAVYNNMGVSTSLSGAKSGIVRANGNVEVGGKVVATGAQVVGAGANGGGKQFKVGGYTFRKHSAREALRGDDAEVFVFFKADGTFKNAIIKICGNPVEATPPKPPTPPKPTPKPSAQCDALDNPVITNRTDVALKAKASTKDGAKISKYTFTIVDSNGKTIVTKDVSTSAGTASTTVKVNDPGTYTAKVVVTTSVGNKTAAACEKKFTIKEAEKPGVSIEKTVNGVEKDVVEVNEEFNYELVVKNTGNTALKDVKVTDKAPAGVTFLRTDKGKIENNELVYTIPELKVGESVTINITATIKEYIENAPVNKACVDAPTVPGNPDDCDDATVEVPPKPEPGKETVCELETNEIITIGEDEFDSSKHSKNLDDCKEEPVVPVTPVTPETPEAPVELPQTGTGNTIMGGLGLGALVTTTIAYVISRRSILG